MSQTYRNPSLAVDVIVEVDGRIVLIERKNPPYGWALPGGFVDLGEKLEDAAIRELKEETGLDVTLECLLSVYSDPERDPRSHVVSAVWVGHAQGSPEGRDDAVRAELFALDALPKTLAFDHQRILDDYMHYKQTGEFPPPRPTLASQGA